MGSKVKWETVRERIPPPRLRLVVWVPHLKTWELAVLIGEHFTLLSGTQTGTVLTWKQVSHYLEIKDPRE